MLIRGPGSWKTGPASVRIGRARSRFSLRCFILFFLIGAIGAIGGPPLFISTIPLVLIISLSYTPSVAANFFLDT
jgi:hypothetical protein